jgi:hypothetical protein
MEGYQDSEIECRPEESGNRTVNFTLNPKKIIREIISSEPSGADIYWGKTKRLMMETGLKTPHTRSMYTDALESWCYQVKMQGYHDSKIECRPEEIGERKVNFILSPAPQH